MYIRSMGIKIKSTKRHTKALELISKYSDQCPKCNSDNISNEDETEMYSCHNCSHQFSEQDYMDKTHIVALLNVNDLADIAEEVASMSVVEYEDFLQNHIY